MSLSILVSILTLSFTVFAEVWTAKDVWSDEKEKLYQTWVQKNWGKDVFARKTNNDNSINQFYGLRVDCADTVYSTRIVFSYLHGLPFVMNDPTGGKKLISNSMNRWDNLPEDQRIRKFLVYAYNIVSTKSLPNDTYPIRMSRETIVPGSLILTTEKNHHSWVVKNIFPTGIPHLVFNSTVGAHSSSVLQERKTWPNGDWVFEGNTTPKGNAGLRYWRKESDLKRPVWEVAGYSEDQYAVKPGNWKVELQKLMQTSEETNQQKVERLIENVCADVQQRVDAVKESEAFLKETGYQCMSEADFDTYSTPSRDRRLADEIIEIRAFLQNLGREGNQISLDEKMWVKLRLIFPQLDVSIADESRAQKRTLVSTNSLCRTKYYSRGENIEKAIDLAEIKRRLFIHQLSSNPNDPPEIRFGEVLHNYKDNCKSWGNLKLTYGEP